MLELLIIADDFTGALDTGVQFAGGGAETRVVTDRNYDYCAAEAGIQVLVMDAETRHLPAKEAYDVVYGIAIRGIASGIPYIYKKTDSALRGNIGSELAALLAASGKNILPFFPAFPKIGRTTEAGYHYINGIPVKESVFGQDPYDPVKCSYIPELIQRQSPVPVRTIRWNEEIGGTQVTPEIVVLDAQEDEQLEELGKQLLDMGGLSVMAGCAGFAAVLPGLLKLKGVPPVSEVFSGKFLVISGSLNPITIRQLSYAQQNGFLRLSLTPEQKLETGYWSAEEGIRVLNEWKTRIRGSTCCIIDSIDPPGDGKTANYAGVLGLTAKEVRERVAKSLGCVLEGLISGGEPFSLLITGGDTLLACMERLVVAEMEPVREMGPGIVLSRFQYQGIWCQVISKSGGFGAETLLFDLAEQILGNHHTAQCCECSR
ncbi:four-carbon acid sugar kinase family protein [Enterocloster asparagiformis]|uniref:four-carbon acid sugar kinase family protein n=1 Tax=Enterocloster asparagiformis TaxID=333367 RepID=UPI002A81B15D|nr:four-carbon acid sugar kinase family protein [Enterocloster asparagiformis]